MRRKDKDGLQWSQGVKTALIFRHPVAYPVEDLPFEEMHAFSFTVDVSVWTLEGLASKRNLTFSVKFQGHIGTCGFDFHRILQELRGL